MLYNDSPRQDYINLLHYLDEIGARLQGELVIDEAALQRVVESYRENFPYKPENGDGGFKGASSFKKAANFIAWFVALGPVSINEHYLSDAYKGMKPNSAIALEIGIFLIEGSQLRQRTGKVVCVDNPIYLSDHSLIDIVDALSCDVTAKSNFMMLSVLLEQITYKTNPDCEYKSDEAGEIHSDPEPYSYYRTQYYTDFMDE